MLKTILFVLVLLLAVNGVLAWQNVSTGSGIDEKCKLVSAAKQAAGDSGGLMLPASAVLFKSVNLFK